MLLALMLERIPMPHLSHMVLVCVVVNDHDYQYRYLHVHGLLLTKHYFPFKDT